MLPELSGGANAAQGGIPGNYSMSFEKSKAIFYGNFMISVVFAAVLCPQEGAGRAPVGLSVKKRPGFPLKIMDSSIDIFFASLYH